MYTNVNLMAPAGVLLLMGTAFLLLLVGLAFIYSVIRKKFGLTKLALFSVGLIGGLYLVGLLIFSFKSSDTILARGQEKHFCEIDCHLAYSIADERIAKTLGEAPNQVTAAGVFRVITVKTRFDENTISPTRGNQPLHPNSRVVAVVDETGRKYFPSPAGQRRLEDSQTAGMPISTPLRPGESYTTAYAFDLPMDIRNPTLVINEGEWITYFVIGHENSPFHKKTRFLI